MENVEYNTITNHFKTNIRFKELCVYILSRFYPLTRDQIINYHDILDLSYSGLMNNSSIVWDSSLIELLKDNMDWSGLWKINGLELDLRFFADYKDYIDFSSIHMNDGVDWSNELLDTYQDLWKWDTLSFRSIVARPRNIAKYNHKFNWKHFSSNKNLNLTDELINQYHDFWDWKKLSANPAFVVGKKEIEKYKEKIDFRGLSRNPSMLPFILAYPNDYEWSWTAFASNPKTIFTNRLVKFLVSKINEDSISIKKYPRIVLTKSAKATIFKHALYNINFDRDFWFSEQFKDIIPWKTILERKPNLLNPKQIKEHFNIENIKNVIPFQIAKKISQEYINENPILFEEYAWSIFRYSRIDRKFVYRHAKHKDWCQLAFNEQFDWDLEFLISNYDRFETNYGLSQNSRIYTELFSDLSNIEVDSIFEDY